MKIVGVIPARYDSSRLPGKPLLDINGYPMIWWVYCAAKRCEKLDEIVVAIDDVRIETVLNSLNIPYVMTSKNHTTAASRICEVSESISGDYFIQINGDEPLMDPDTIGAVIPDSIPVDAPFGTNIITKMRNPVEVNDVSNIKMVFDKDMNALYMSRQAIPFPFKSIEYEYYKHVGIIGYNRAMLEIYKNEVPGRFEMIEGIDTMRFLDYGAMLKLIIVEKYETLSVDTYMDYEKVQKMMKGRTF